MKLDEMVAKFLLIADLLDEVAVANSISLNENPSYERFIQNWAQNMMFPGRERILEATLQITMYGRSESGFTFDTIIRETRAHIDNVRKTTPTRVHQRRPS